MIVSTVALERYLNTLFNKTMVVLSKQMGAAGLLSLVTDVPSTKSEERYGWLGDLPVVKEWLSDKDYAGLKDYDYTIKNKDWYNAIGIDRNELEDDQMGMIKPRIESMVAAMQNFKADLIAQLIEDGETNKAYDDQAFFANRTDNDNLLAGTGITLDNLKADLTTARAVMMRFKSDTSKVLRLTLDTIVCPPELEEPFLELVTSATIPGVAGGNVANPFKTWIKNVVAEPTLTDTGDWYGFCTTFPLKPFFYQNRKEPVPVLDDTQVKRNRVLGYSVEMRGNAGYGFYQMAIKVINT